MQRTLRPHSGVLPMQWEQTMWDPWGAFAKVYTHCAFDHSYAWAFSHVFCISTMLQMLWNGIHYPLNATYWLVFWLIVYRVNRLNIFRLLFELRTTCFSGYLSWARSCHRGIEALQAEAYSDFNTYLRLWFLFFFLRCQNLCGAATIANIEQFGKSWLSVGITCLMTVDDNFITSEDITHKALGLEWSIVYSSILFPLMAHSLFCIFIIHCFNNQ